MRNRHARRALLAGTMPVALPLMGPHAVAMLGRVLPDDIDRIQEAQALARSGVPWPPGLEGSAEALFIGNELLNATPGELEFIGRAAVRINDYAALKVQRTHDRKRRAQLRAELAAARRPRRVVRHADLVALASRRLTDAELQKWARTL
jgi:hypothetical protein